MLDQLLIKSAVRLCVALHKKSPQILGEELAGIVEKHAIAVAVAGLGTAWLPGVGATAAMLTSAGFVWSMYVRISSRIGLPFSKHILKSVATAIGTNIVSSIASSVIIGSALSFIPGLGSIGASALMAGVVFSLTWTSGIVYFKVLTRFCEAGVNFEKVSEEDLKLMAKEVVDQEDIKAMMKQAKSQFKEAKARGDIKKSDDNVKPMEEV